MSPICKYNIVFDISEGIKSDRTMKKVSVKFLNCENLQGE